MLVAMAITTIVLGGAVAAIGVGGRTFGAATSGIAAAPTLDGMARMSADVELALHFTESTATAVSFYVPDRTGDGAPDLIRYAWSGSDGDPITLSMNGSTPWPIVPSVTSLSMDYFVATTPADATWHGVAPPAAADELVFERAYSGSPAQTFSVDDGVSVAAIVQPASPSSGRPYAITRIIVPMTEAAHQADNVNISVHRVNMLTAVPMPTALTTTTIRKQDLPETLEFVEVTFDTEVVFDDEDFVAIVISSAKSKPSVDVPLENSPQFLTDGWVATTSVPGAWVLSGARDLPIEIYAVEAP
jgi:hypothetical protein